MDRFLLEVSEGELILIRRMLTAAEKGEPVQLGTRTRALKTLREKATDVPKIRARGAQSSCDDCEAPAVWMGKGIRLCDKHHEIRAADGSL